MVVDHKAYLLRFWTNFLSFSNHNPHLTSNHTNTFTVPDLNGSDSLSLFYLSKCYTIIILQLASGVLMCAFAFWICFDVPRKTETHVFLTTHQSSVGRKLWIYEEERKPNIEKTEAVSVGANKSVRARKKYTSSREVRLPEMTVTTC